MTGLHSKRIGIALSGGGTRAAAFHLGVLKFFAEKCVLDRVAHISSVSGGSLVTGLILHVSDYSWPSPDQYLSRVLPETKKILCGASLQADGLVRLIFNPLNWRYLLTRAAVLSTSIQELWGITCTLDSLPPEPVWSINGTTAENGRRFRFKNKTAGDYELGYADFSDFKLADALAVSAAFPGGIGPLPVVATNFSWTKRDAWDLAEPPKPISAPYPLLHLYDGGVYDNLGLEPLFDTGTQSLKVNRDIPVDVIVVSDAGAPYVRQTIPGPLHPRRFKRVADVALDQARSLRVRSFANYLKLNPGSGQYLQIGSNPEASLKRYGRCQADTLDVGSVPEWMSAGQISSVQHYRTSLGRMAEHDFEKIVLHGYQTALWNSLAFGLP